MEHKAGHVVSYSRRSRFFCDCGAGAAAARGITCIALTPRAMPPQPAGSRARAMAASARLPIRGASAGRAQHGAPQSGSAAEASGGATATIAKATAGRTTASVAAAAAGERRTLQPFSLSGSDRRALLYKLSAPAYADSLFRTYVWLLRSLQGALPEDAEPSELDLLSSSMPLVVSNELLAPRHSVRAGAFDLKQRTDGPHARELRTLLSTGGLSRAVLAASSKGLLAVAEADKLHVLDAAPALAAGDAAKAGGAAPSSAALTNPASVPSGIGGPGAVLGGPGSALSAAERAAAAAAAVAAGGSNPSERAGLRSACKASLGFEIVMVSFNAANEQQLLVSGLKDTVALTLGSRGEVVSRVVVELMLDALGTASTHILRTGWLPHSSSACFVLTTQFLKVYDLAQDKISPAHAFHALDDEIKDVAFKPHDGGAHGGACGSRAARAHREWAAALPAALAR
jgi:E3 ubiquitin-protein ligase UBR4